MFAREVGYVVLAWARQWGREEALRRYQRRRLDAMLAFAVDRVPYYRDRPAYRRPPLRSLDELGDLPLLTKDEVRAHVDEVVADGLVASRCREYRTSGTTGRRLRVLHDAASDDYQFASCVRRFLATRRYRPTDRLSHLRHFVPPSRGFQSVGLFRRSYVPSEEPMAEIVRRLLANRPHVVIAYPVHLRAVLRALTPEELARLRAALKFVMTESELLVPEHRRALEEGFGVPVFDEYSSWETLNIYYECHRGGRHIAEDRLLVEVVDGDGRPLPDGTEGSIVVTHFLERAMPLVRYALGDLGVIAPQRCPCGRRFRTMHLTRGRENDSVVLPSGARLFSDTFLEMAEQHPGLAECWVRQDASGTVRVHVVPDGTLPVGTVVDEVRRRLVGVAGGPFPLDVVAADAVPTGASGKGRFVESSYAPAPGMAG